MSEWFEETLHEDFRQSLKGSLLFKQDTGLHDLRIYNNKTFGNFMTLDGVVQVTQKDEFIYHEMMTHPLFLALNNPTDILVIGGGDGGILREVLKHPEVQQVDFVEIDERVIEICRQYFPTISSGSFDDPRVNTIIADGAQFVATTNKNYDAIIVDSSDPIGPSAALFRAGFYKNILRSLKEQGLFIRQTGSSFLQQEELSEQYLTVKDIFPVATVQIACVPTYVGGFFSFVIGSKKTDIANISQEALDTKYNNLNLGCKYYNPQMHFGALALPGYIQEQIL